MGILTGTREESPASKRWKAASQAGAPGVVGSFYQSIAERITRGEPTKDRRDGDLVVWSNNGTAIGIEVKSGNSGNSLRIAWDQFQNHQARGKQFPYDGFSYLFFSYTSHERMHTAPEGDHQKRRRILCASVMNGKGKEFLAERTRHLWVMPIPILERMREEHTLTERAFPSDHDSTALVLGRRYIRSFELMLANRNDGWSVRRGIVNLRKANGIAVVPFTVTTFEHPDLPSLPLRHVQWI